MALVRTVWLRRQRDRWAHDPARRVSGSHRKRKLIEQAFGWLKTVALSAAADDSSTGCLASAPRYERNRDGEGDCFVQ